jgi:hypothetical protein
VKLFGTCDNEQGCDLHDKKPDPPLGEKRRTPREEARLLVDEVFTVREEQGALAAEMAKLQAKGAKLAERERDLVEILAKDHGLFYNPDR